MHLKFFLLLSLLVIGKFVRSQQVQRPAILWQKWYGGSGADYANDVLLTADGGMIVAGYTNSSDGDVTGNHGGNDGWVIKLNAAGQKQWQRCVGGSAGDKFQKIIKCAGGFLCVGSTTSNDGDITNLHNAPGNDFKRDYLVVKLSDSGTVIWSKAFGGSQDDYAMGCTETSDGNFVIIGTTNSIDGDIQSENETGTDAWIFKINSSGALLWENTMRNTLFNTQYRIDEGYSVAETPDHQLLAYISRYKVTDTSFYKLLWAEDTVMIYDTATYTGFYSKPGVLYRVNPGTGQYEYILETEGNGYLNMSLMPDGIYFSYSNLRWVLNDPGNIHSGVCGQEESYVTKLDYATNSFQPVPTSVTSCQYTIYSRYFPGLNGAAGTENGTWMQVGESFATRGDCGGVTNAMIFPVKENSYGYVYGGIASDGFNAIKAFSSGYEFVCAGYTSSVDGDLAGRDSAEFVCDGTPADFWIVKISLSTNQVSGHVFLDENNNNVHDTEEPAFTKAMVQVTGHDYNVKYGIANGFYNAELDTGSFVTQLVFNNPAYYSAIPVSDTSIFHDHFSSDTIDFAVHKNGDFIDNTLSFFASGAPVRPGRTSNYTIRVGNNGTVPLFHKTIMLIKDSRLQFENASLTPQSISADTIIWNIDTLAVDGTKIIHVNLLPAIPPILNSGDSVYTFVSIDTTADVNTSDNVASITQVIRNSYDPNDKQEVHAGSITKLELQRDNYLTYTIRFQNTGNDTAFNITVRDVLDEKLSNASFEMLSASHPYQLKIKDGKYLSWEFKDVMLVDSNQNEPASHGYITYRIKPKNNLIIGDSIHNSASIYFDFNPPVITNTEITAVTRSKAIWTGAVDTNWHNSQNWNIKEVPDAETEVWIPGGVSQYPVINNNATCFLIKVDATGEVTISSGFNLEVTGK